MDINRAVLHTNQLIIRPVCENDLLDIYEYASDLDIDMMLNFPHSTINETKGFIKRAIDEWNDANAINWEFVIELDGKVVGGLGIEYAGSRSICEIGWIINKKYRRQQIASNAANALMDFTFRELNPLKIIAHCDIENEASRALMANLGMRPADSHGTRVYPKTGKQSVEMMYEIDRESFYSKRYKCPCCFTNILEDGPGKYAICPVCLWEDDPLQAKDIQYSGGANRISLADARKNYKLFGVSDEKYKNDIIGGGDINVYKL